MAKTSAVEKNNRRRRLVASQAEAARFLDTLRASALSGEAMQ